MFAGILKWPLLLIGSFILVASVCHSSEADSQSPSLSSRLRTNLEEAESLRNAGDPEKALAIAREALQQAEREGLDDLITEALFQLSLANYFREEFQEARAYMEIGLTHARLHGLSALEGDFLNAQGVLEWKQGNLFEASAKLEEALEVKRALEDWVSVASIANNLGNIASSLERYSEAVAFYERGLEWLGNRNNLRMRASLLSNLGESLIPLGEFARAEGHLLESLELEREAGDPGNLAYTYFNLGELRAAEGKSKEAVELYQKALDLQQSVDSSWAAALTRLRLSSEHLRAGQMDTALAVLQPGFDAVRELNALTLLRDYADQFARIYETSGNPRLARYYKELNAWFIERIGPDPLPVGEVAPAEPTSLTGRQAGTGLFNLSFQRMIALALIVLLVLILIVENRRLRRLMRHH